MVDVLDLENRLYAWALANPRPMRALSDLRLRGEAALSKRDFDLRRAIRLAGSVDAALVQAGTRWSSLTRLVESAVNRRRLRRKAASDRYLI